MMFLAFVTSIWILSFIIWAWAGHMAGTYLRKNRQQIKSQLTQFGLKDPSHYMKGKK